MVFTAGSEDPLYEFGEFLADPVIGRLYRGNEEVPLTPKAFKVLMVLVGSRGQLVDRHELFRQVWPDIFVEPNNLARNISMIRRALHERDCDHEYIVTVNGRGYRFVTPVSLISRGDFAERSRQPDLATGAVQPVPVEGNKSVAGETAIVDSQSTGGRLTTWLPAYRHRVGVAAMIALLLSVAGALTLGSRGEVGDRVSSRRLWQLTMTGRLDGEPAWSSDGQSIAYSSDREGTEKIWIQRVSGGSPVRITSGPARDSQPSWSPDGRQIAFRSERDGGGLFVVSMDSSAVRRIAEFGDQPRWSAEGSRILFCSGRDIYLVGLDGAPPSQLATELLPNVPGRCRVAWHPDGQRISVYGRHDGKPATLLTMPVRGGSPVVSRIASSVEQRLRESDLRLGNFTWAPQGDALYFEGRSERTQNLWRIRVNARTLEWIAGPDRLTTGSGLDTVLAISPDGKRLAFGSRFERTAVWSLPFDPVGGRITGDGQPVTPEGANARILDISPDGNRLVYRVQARDTDQLWIRSLDQEADRLRKVEIDATIVHPRWSRDGSQLAYVRRPTNPVHSPAVVVLAADDGKERQVKAAAQTPEMVYDWGLDGGSFLVRCRAHSTRAAICRLPMEGGGDSAAQMDVIAADATRNLYAGAYSPDGRWVSFIAAANLSRSAVFVSSSTSGGGWIPITNPEDHAFRDLPRWSPDGRTLYFLSNHTGFWNLWGRRFDPDRGTPTGEPFQISHFDTSVKMLGPDVSSLQVAITRERLILPVTQISGAVWILENVDQ